MRNCRNSMLRRYFKILVALAVSLGFVFYYYAGNLRYDNEGGFTGQEEAEWELMLTNKSKVILLYTSYHNTPKWLGLEIMTLHQHLAKFNCMITFNRSRLQRADAVVFHGRDVELHRNGKYSAKVLKRVRQSVPERQKWIFLSQENPQKNARIYAPYDGLFNWTSTFSQKSDVFIPYSSYVKVNQDEPDGKLINYAEGKPGMVAWAVSNCNLMRQEYAMELQRYVNLTVYGKCRHYFEKKGNCKHWVPSCNKEIASYKFFLAFENKFCDDYVTEKYWERIQQGAVPVVMGATVDKRLIIPGSFIDTSQFKSIKALADYLLYLNANDTAYNEYFKWKSTYKISPNDRVHFRICQALHSSKYKTKSQVTLSQAFSFKTMCTPFNQKMEEFLRQIRESVAENPPSSWKGITKIGASQLAWIKSQLF